MLLFLLWRIFWLNSCLGWSYCNTAFQFLGFFLSAIRRKDIQQNKKKNVRREQVLQKLVRDLSSYKVGRISRVSRIFLSVIWVSCKRGSRGRTTRQEYTSHWVGNKNILYAFHISKLLVSCYFAVQRFLSQPSPLLHVLSFQNTTVGNFAVSGREKSQCMDHAKPISCLNFPHDWWFFLLLCLQLSDKTFISWFRVIGHLS